MAFWRGCMVTMTRPECQPTSTMEEHAVKPSINLDPILPRQAAEIAETEGVEKAGKKAAATFLLAVTAGVFIALAFVFCITVLTGAGSMPWGISRLFGGLVFSTGLILLVVCGGELFTSSVLTCVACASGRISVRRMLKNWAVVYAGNLVGALCMVVLMAMARVCDLDGGAWGITLLQMAQHKLHYGFGQAFALALLCNLLVCLAVWMTFSSRRPLEKAALVVLPVAMFVSAGFEHVVANMFLLPFAIVVVQGADSAWWLLSDHQAAEFADVTLANFARSNLVPVTLGNIAGGLLVGLGYWCIYRRQAKALPAANVAILQHYAHAETREEVAMPH